MLPTTIRSPPAADDYVPLAEYQSQTPETFSDSKAVLHCHLESATASIPQEQLGKLAIFPADAAVSDEFATQTVSVFATSANFTIFSTTAEAGVSIPYPSISIHAIKQLPGSNDQAVWMQIEVSDGGVDDDDFGTVELTIATDKAKELYEAIAACSNLHPDPNDDEDEDEGDYADRIVFEGSAEHEALEGFTGVLRGAVDGGLPPPMPGSGGWITADNVHEYFDADGNWIGPDAEEVGGEELGDGAGNVHARDEGVNGHDADDADDADSKRPRVD